MATLVLGIAAGCTQLVGFAASLCFESRLPSAVILISSAAYLKQPSNSPYFELGCVLPPLLTFGLLFTEVGNAAWGLCFGLKTSRVNLLTRLFLPMAPVIILRRLLN